MDFTLLFMYFITVNKYRFCISVIGYINAQIIGKKKVNIGRSLVSISIPLQMQLLCFLYIAKMNFVDTDFICLVTFHMSYYTN